MNYRWLSLMCFATFACAPPKSGSLRLPSGPRLTPLAMTDAVPARALSMHMEIQRDGVPFHFDAFSEQEPGRLALVGMTPLGTRGFSAIWAAGRFDYEHLPFYKLPIPAQELVLAYQLIYFPAALLSAELQQHALTLEETDGLRSLHYRGRPLVRIHYQKQRAEIRLEHVTRGYTLLVKTREDEALDP